MSGCAAPRLGGKSARATCNEMCSDARLNKRVQREIHKLHKSPCSNVGAQLHRGTAITGCATQHARPIHAFFATSSLARASAIFLLLGAAFVPRQLALASGAEAASVEPTKPGDPTPPRVSSDRNGS